MTSAKVKQLFIHPIKGLTPQACDRVILQAGHGIPGDRAFALMYEGSEGEGATLDSKQVPWMKKNNFIMQNDWPGLAGLSCHYEATSATLRVKRQAVELLCEPTQTQTGRDRISAFFTGYLAALSPTATARHPEKAPLRLVGSADGSTRYPDREPVHISLISQASLDAISDRVECPVDVRRFRPNIVLEGISAWEEFNWVGKEFLLGNARIAIAAPINRCLNIDVNPDTGEPDCSLFAALQSHFGHRQTGVLATISVDGSVAVGDALVECQTS